MSSLTAYCHTQCTTLIFSTGIKIIMKPYSCESVTTTPPSILNQVNCLSELSTRDGCFSPLHALPSPSKSSHFFLCVTLLSVPRPTLLLLNLNYCPSLSASSRFLCSLHTSHHWALFLKHVFHHVSSMDKDSNGFLLSTVFIQSS